MSDGPLRVYGVTQESVVDGPGIRYVLFLQGCTHGCPHCHNPGSHPVEGGYVKTQSSVIADVASNRLLDGVTFSGGEPFLQADKLATLAERLRAVGCSVMVYSGYTWERLQEDPSHRALLAHVDVLVDGPYVHALRSLSLRWRGSSNQRVIHVPSSLAQGTVVLLAES